jgi:hypothetical protein
MHLFGQLIDLIERCRAFMALNEMRIGCKSDSNRTFSQNTLLYRLGEGSQEWFRLSFEAELDEWNTSFKQVYHPKEQ